MSLRLSRRELLALMPGLLLSRASLAQVSPNNLVITDPGCPPEAFTAITDYFRKSRLEQKPLSDEKRIRDGRAWLAGKAEETLAKGESAQWAEVPAKNGPPVRVRVLCPPFPVRGVVLAIHGGGWSMGTALSDEKRNWKLARAANVAVVSPDYRLAPEHPFPAAPDDCETVARWLVEESPRRFGPGPLAIMGGSAGSHLAATTLLRLEPSVRQAFRSAVLYYGVYDLGRSEVWRSSDEQDFPDLSPAEMDLFLSWFLPGLSDQQRRAPGYSPLYADLRAMPPALFLVGGADLLASDSLLMARKWAQAGNFAELVEYPGGPHGFNGFDLDCGLDPDAYAAQFIVKNL